MMKSVCIMDLYMCSCSECAPCPHHFPPFSVCPEGVHCFLGFLLRFGQARSVSPLPLSCWHTSGGVCPCGRSSHVHHRPSPCSSDIRVLTLLGASPSLVDFLNSGHNSVNSLFIKYSWVNNFEYNVCYKWWTFDHILSISYWSMGHRLTSVEISHTQDQYFLFVF